MIPLDLPGSWKRAAGALLGRGGTARLRALRLWLAGGEGPTVPEIAPLHPRPSRVDAPRLNLLIPSVRPEHVFGGISTALAFLRAFEGRYERLRVIALHDSVGRRAATLDGYAARELEEDGDAPRQLLSAARRRGRGCTLPLGAGDRLIATTWASAYLARRLITWQSRHFQAPPVPLVYLIQDYEPAFFPWSSRFLLARSTYESADPTLAVFNTGLLRDFFHAQGHAFAHEFAFEPRMHPVLLALRPTEGAEGDEGEALTKRRQLLVYGRPSTPRNAFSLLIEGLRLWARTHPRAAQWRVLSAGEHHRDLELGSGVRLRSLGKLRLEEYARMLRESAVGVSLMVSPHPSYPPLEMAHHGMWVVTNAFAGKDLSAWHENILSLDSPTPEALAGALGALCARVEADPRAGWRGRSHRPEYLDGGEPFPFAAGIHRLLEARRG